MIGGCLERCLSDQGCLLCLLNGGQISYSQF
jgi:hypothetical protein